MSVIGLIVAVFGAAVVVRMLVLGAASADGRGFRRDNDALVYWFIVFVAVIIDVAFFYLALH